MTRRSLVSLLVAGGSVVIAGVVGVPALLSGFSPVLQRRGGPVWRAVGALEEFPIGSLQASLVPLDRSGWPRTFPELAVFVWRTAEAELVVFSRSCTDLACPLDYDAGSACFYCPCHGGIFAQDGRRLAGPPNGPMFRYDHRIREGVLEIDLTSIPPGA